MRRGNHHRDAARRYLRMRKRAPRDPSPKKKVPWWKALVALGVVVGIGIVIAIISGEALRYNIVSERIYKHTLILSTALWVAPWVFRKLRRLSERPSKSSVGRGYAWGIVLFSGAILMTWIALVIPAILLNCMPDRSTPASHHVRVVNCSINYEKYGSKDYFATVESWDKSHSTERIHVTRSIYRRLDAGAKSLRISVKKGLLGYAWIPEGGIEIDDR